MKAQEIRVEAFASKFLLRDVCPKRFGIVTAFSKTHEREKQSLANWQADRSLFAAIKDAGFEPFSVIEVLCDGDITMPGYGFAAPDTKAVAEIAKRFNQESFYWVNNGKLQIKDAKSLAFDDLGSFDDFVI